MFYSDFIQEKWARSISKQIPIDAFIMLSSNIAFHCIQILDLYYQINNCITFLVFLFKSNEIEWKAFKKFNFKSVRLWVRLLQFEKKLILMKYHVTNLEWSFLISIRIMIRNRRYKCLIPYRQYTVVKFMGCKYQERIKFLRVWC